MRARDLKKIRDISEEIVTLQAAFEMARAEEALSGKVLFKPSRVLKYKLQAAIRKRKEILKSHARITESESIYAAELARKKVLLKLAIEEQAEDVKAVALMINDMNYLNLLPAAETDKEKTRRFLLWQDYQAKLSRVKSSKGRIHALEGQIKRWELHGRKEVQEYAGYYGRINNILDRAQTEKETAEFENTSDLINERNAKLAAGVKLLEESRIASTVTTVPDAFKVAFEPIKSEDDFMALYFNEPIAQAPLAQEESENSKNESSIASSEEDTSSPHELQPEALSPEH